VTIDDGTMLVDDYVDEHSKRRCTHKSSYTHTFARACFPPRPLPNASVLQDRECHNFFARELQPLPSGACAFFADEYRWASDGGALLWSYRPRRGGGDGDPRVAGRSRRD
jgi:hypothetical protein